MYLFFFSTYRMWFFAELEHRDNILEFLRDGTMENQPDNDSVKFVKASLRFLTITALF